MIQYDIKNAPKINYLVIILIWNQLTGDIKKQHFNNVYAIDIYGNIIWNIKEVLGSRRNSRSYSPKSGFQIPVKATVTVIIRRFGPFVRFTPKHFL